jgi:hypothetical protein
MILRTLSVALLGLAIIAAPAQAAKADKGKKGGRILTRFDRDSNGAIEGAEVARVQAAYAHLATLDTNKDGDLSASELAAAEVPVGKRGNGGKKKSQ